MFPFYSVWKFPLEQNGCKNSRLFVVVSLSLFFGHHLQNQGFVYNSSVYLIIGRFFVVASLIF